jgi:hypothetical protein
MHCSEVDETATDSANFWSAVILQALRVDAASWSSTPGRALVLRGSLVTRSPSWARPADEFLAARPNVVPFIAVRLAEVERRSR